jgi:CheY-like chemotaxis protein
MHNPSLSQIDQPRCQSGIRTPTLCVVAPEGEDRERWQSLAQAQGASLHVVAGAEAALRLCRGATVDLWVINTELPGLSGFELSSMLKARPGDAATYLFADEYSPEAERAAWRARATWFGCKTLCVRAVESWLANWRTRRRRTPPRMAQRLR